LKDKVAIITGGASGIGAAIAEALALRGARIVLADSDSATGEATREILAQYTHVRFVEVDVRDRDAVVALVDDVYAQLGRIDFMFNNAGIAAGGEVLHTSPELWDRILDVNLRGVVHGVEASYAVMARQGFGHIINTSSMAGLFPIPLNVPYVASKFGVYGLSVAMRPEAAARGVKVSVVCPGPVATPLLDRVEYAGGISDEERAMIARYARGMDARRCARTILRGVARNRAVIPISASTRFGWRLHGHFPGLFRWVTGYGARIVLRRRDGS
jgi:NAD(P)-dependent dehydrogenase (short-subunit alcohol dehydrogenase family)